MAIVSSRAIRFHEVGEPTDVLREERVEIPDPPSGNVRVRVLATGLNPADWELCRGFMPGTLPRGIGYDVAGIVDAIGADVDQEAGAGRESVRVGDVVFGTADFVGQPSAGAADFAVLNNWFPVPAGLDPVQAATLPMVVQTAAWTLQLIDLAPGATLLVHGGGGMVGYAAVQIALRRGARVIDFVLDTPRPSPGTLPDLIALAGGDPRRVVTISNHEEARKLGARVNIDELGPGLTPLSVLLPEYALLAAQGAFRLPVAKAYSFENWGEAVELSLSGNPHGKVVLVPDLQESRRSARETTIPSGPRT